MAEFLPALEYVLENEGEEYTDTNGDRGGPTKFGITQDMLARAKGRAVTAAEVEALTKDDAQGIYLLFFWTPLRLIALESQGLATAILDGAVLGGDHRSLVYAQRVAGIIPSDGIAGPKTTDGFNAEPWSAAEMLALVGQWQDYFVALCDRRLEQRQFLRGWLARSRRMMTLVS